MPDRGFRVVAGTMPGRGFRVVAGVMAAVFVLSAAVQWNDPDPLAWIAIYGAAAALAALAAAGRLPWWPNLAMLALAAALTALWLPTVAGARREAFTSFEMKAPEDEEPREAGGLALVLVWSAVQTHRAFHHRNTRGRS